MKQLSAKTLLALVALIALFSFNACQKEMTHQASSISADQLKTTERSAAKITYGVTVFDGVNPSMIVGIDEGTGTVVSMVQAYVVEPNGNIVLFDDLKGICLTDVSQYFLTTGVPANILLGTSAYDNSLCKVDPNTGECSFFGSVSANTVSDLEFNPATQTFFGLNNNSNQIIEISQDINGNYTVYSAPANITGIINRTLSGLSLVRDITGLYLVGAASRPDAAAFASQLFIIPPGGGAAALLTDLAPQGDFAGGHCGLGFDVDLNHLAVNRRATIATVAPGLSEINPWVPPLLPPVTGTSYWGFQGLNFEDLTSSVY